MTKQQEVLGDPKYIPVLDHGFVGLVDTFGTDASIVQAARVSYGDGTKSVREDRGLIRYLMKHKHTSPFEMCQVKLHIKLPIFVMRQWVRHRTASLNEYSGRYSVMTDEFYLPNPEHIKPQSVDNKQGRAGEVSAEDATAVRFMMSELQTQTYDVYKALMGDRTAANPLDLDPFNSDDPLFSGEFEGVARELARTVLPVGNYTELYWSQNLHNLMHLMKLRMDEHAQYEIRVFAQAVYDLIQPIFPAALEAFDDYVREATSNSRMETSLLKIMLASNKPASVVWAELLTEAGSDKAFAEKHEMSVRELGEFRKQWDLPSYASLQPEAPVVTAKKAPSKKKAPAAKSTKKKKA